MKESVHLGATAARLGQAVQLSKCIANGKPIGMTVAAIMAFDLADGIVARRDGVDGPKRRALDSAVDSVIIAAGLFSVYKKIPKARAYAGLLAAREVFVATGWAVDLVRTGQVKKGDDFHKLPSASIAAFALGATSGNKTALRATGLLAVGINIPLAYDYYKGWTQPERNRVLDTGVVEVPGFYEARNVLKTIRNTQLTAGNVTPQLEAPIEPVKLPPQEAVGVIERLDTAWLPQLTAGHSALYLEAPAER